MALPGFGATTKQASTNWMNELMRMMSQYSGLMGGRGTPQELPWMRQFQEQISRYGQDQDTELIKQAIARGVTGNSLANVLSQSQQSRNQGIMNMFNQIYTQAPQQMASLGGMATDAFLKKRGQNLQYAINQSQQQQGSGFNPMQAIMMALGGLRGGMQAYDFMKGLGVGGTQSTSTPFSMEGNIPFPISGLPGY